MEIANKWVQPTKFTGDYSDGFAGYTWLDYDGKSNAYHPGEDYNFGAGDQDLGQDVLATSSGIVVHASNSTAKPGYGNLLVIKHQIGYNLKRYIQQTYGIETDVVYSLYAHLKDIVVKVGDTVSPAQLVGHIGKTGTDWAHLHFELYYTEGDLKGLSWRFYPVGWTKEKVARNWIPAYFFIEATKQLSDLMDTFLGKSKDYWIQVEKDRESLLKQVGEKDKEWAVRLELQQKNHEIEIGSLNTKVLEATTAKEKAEFTLQSKTGEFTKKEADLKKEIETLKIRNSQLINQNADNYKFWEAIRIAVVIAKKQIGL